MSYTLIEERHVKAARKQHRCIWCGQHIDPGAPYVYERSVFEGQPQSHHYHPECAEACQDLARYEGGECSFSAWQEERPQVQSKEVQS